MPGLAADALCGGAEVSVSQPEFLVFASVRLADVLSQLRIGEEFRRQPLIRAGQNLIGNALDAAAKRRRGAVARSDLIQACSMRLASAVVLENDNAGTARAMATRNTFVGVMLCLNFRDHASDARADLSVLKIEGKIHFLPRAGKIKISWHH